MRNSNIELFRIALMVAICLWHLCVYGLGWSSMIAESLWNTIISALTVPAVNCFIIISGYYEIRISHKKTFRLIFQALLFFIICTILKYFIWNQFSVRSLIHLLPISTNTWWFLTKYFILMLLSPFINKGITICTTNILRNSVIGLFFIDSIGMFINMSSGGTSLLHMIMLYLLGRYLMIKNFQMRKYLSITLFLVSSSMMILFTRLLGIYELKYAIWVMNYNNPIIICQSVLLVMFVLSLKARYNNNINALGRYSLSIYLLTEGLGGVLYKHWMTAYNHSVFLSLFYILFSIIIALFCGWQIDILFQKVDKRLNNRIYNKQIGH